MDSQSVKTTEQGEPRWGKKVIPGSGRIFAWLGRYRRLSKDYKFLPETEESFIYTAMTRLMLKRLAS